MRTPEIGVRYERYGGHIVDTDNRHNHNTLIKTLVFFFLSVFILFVLNLNIF